MLLVFYTTIRFVVGNSYVLAAALVVAECINCLFVFQGMTGQGWVWLGSDGVLATPPINQTKATQAMQGTVGTMPKGTLYTTNPKDTVFVNLFCWHYPSQ